MTYIMSIGMKEPTKTKTYRGKRYSLHTISTSGKAASALGKGFDYDKIPNLQVHCWHNGDWAYAIYVR